jgi:acetolactate synthase-1/2/3 large subunit
LPIVVVVFDDRSLSLIDIKQRQRGLHPCGVELGPVDWAALAKSFGLAAFVARDQTEAADAIEQALDRSGPALIAARIDPSNYPATMKVVRG